MKQPSNFKTRSGRRVYSAEERSTIKTIVGLGILFVMAFLVAAAVLVTQ